MDELTADRSSYLSALARQKDNLNRNNNILVNPSVSDATTFGNSNDLNYYQQKSRNSNVSNVAVDNRNGWQRMWDTISDFTNNITKGFLNFVDGIGDFFGLITGGIAEAAGNHQMAEDIKNNWINVNWVDKTVSALDKVANLPSHIATGDLFTEDYWTRFDENRINTVKENSYLGNNEVFQSITQGIGSVLPSIAIGILTAGAGTAVQGVTTLGSLGVSAYGNQGQEALEAGANYGQAHASGAISGTIEVGTEIVIGGLLGKLFNKGAKEGAKAALKVNGVTLGGKKALEKAAKAGFKDFTKNAIEEGLEEVASELLSPLAKRVYDEKAFETYTTPEGRKQLIKDSALAFLGGAVGSFVGGGIQKKIAKNQLAQYQKIEESFGGETGMQLATEAEDIVKLAEQQAEEIKKGQKGEQANIDLIEENETKIKEKFNDYMQKLNQFEVEQPENFKKFSNRMVGNIADKANDVVYSVKADEGDFKSEQLEIIKKTNPMNDDYHNGIRNVEDIKSFEEVLELNDEKEGQFAWGDYTRKDAMRDLKNGTVTIYSSKPIENGNFVSTSYIQAQQYAGGEGAQVYSKKVNINEVAWINGDEGQYANVDSEYKKPTYSQKVKTNYVSMNDTTEILRRVLRDVNERERSVESVIEQYLTTVKPMHDKYIAPFKNNADIIVPEGGFNDAAFRLISDALKFRLSKDKGEKKKCKD